MQVNVKTLSAEPFLLVRTFKAIFDIWSWHRVLSRIHSSSWLIAKLIERKSCNFISEQNSEIFIITWTIWFTFTGWRIHFDWFVAYTSIRIVHIPLLTYPVECLFVKRVFQWICSSVIKSTIFHCYENFLRS